MAFSFAQIFPDSVFTTFLPPSRKIAKTQKHERKGLKVALNDEVLYFPTLDDFSFAVESRTSIPTSRFRRLLKRTLPELHEESRKIKSLEKNLANILEDGLCDGAECGKALRQLGTNIFSTDHEWRPLMRALIQLGARYDTYKRLAIIKYLQYLGERHHVLRLVLGLKGVHAEAPSNTAAARTAAVDETGTFDSANAPPADLFDRLQRDEATKISVPAGRQITLRVATHRITVSNECGWSLIDPDGERHHLFARQNAIGRGPLNDVEFSRKYCDVSRQHLLLEPVDNSAILVTDLSSHGTYLPAS